ncbi:TonB-dependent receptor [candidate division KSB1 bacterium]|nr:TonB-dependent receptor [candidate division KSB1 bacterium]
MFTRRMVVLVLATVFYVSGTYAAETGTICGTVTDSLTGEPLHLANVQIESTNLGAATDSDGRFCIKDIPAGVVRLSVSAIGFSKAATSFNLKADQSIEIEVEMVIKAIPMDEVSVTALRYPINISNSPAPTDILTAAEIRQSVAQNLGEALETVGGVQIKNYGYANAQKTVSIRGSADNQVLVLVDGQRFNNPQTGSMDFSWLPIDGIKRIEVVKGGNSALYGSDAIGGVVNIITSSPTQGKVFTGNLESTIGNWGSRTYLVSGFQDLGKLKLDYSFNNQKSDGNFKYQTSAGIDTAMINNDFKAENAFFKSNYSINQYSNLTFTTIYNRMRKGLPGPVSWPSAVARSNGTRNYYSVGYNQRVMSCMNINGNVYYHRTFESVDQPDSSPLNSRHLNKSFGLEIQDNLILASGIVLISGLELRNDRISSTSVHFRKRYTYSAYSQVILESQLIPMTKVSLIPAIRFDRYSDIGNKFSPKVGFAISSTNKNPLTLRANWGRVFRAPTFNDLYWPQDMFSVGNPILRPESGKTYDIGARYNIERKSFSTMFDISYFEQDMRDLIIWADRGDYVWTPQNIDKAKIRGIESSLDFSLFEKFITFGINHTYLDAKNAANNSLNYNNVLIYRPKQKFDFDFGMNYKLASFNLIYHYIDKRFTDEANLNTLPAHGIVDLTFSVQPMLGIHEMTVKADVLNMFDRDYVVMQDYPMPGRNYRLTLAYGFGF